MFSDDDFIQYEEDLKIAISRAKSPDDQLISDVVPAISDRLCALEQKISLTVSGNERVSRKLEFMDTKLDLTSNKSDNIALALQNAVVGTLGHIGDAVSVIRDESTSELLPLPENSSPPSSSSNNITSAIPQVTMSRKTVDISTLWKEYTVGINGNPAIRTMERQFGTAWRKSSSETKFYTNRLPLLREIQRMLDSEQALDQAILHLENERTFRNLTFNQFLYYIKEKNR